MLCFRKVRSRMVDTDDAIIIKSGKIVNRMSLLSSLETV